MITTASVSSQKQRLSQKKKKTPRQCPYINFIAFDVQKFELKENENVHLLQVKEKQKF